MSYMFRFAMYPASRLGLRRIFCIAIGTSLLGACDLTTVPMPEPNTVEPAQTDSGPADTQVLGYTAKLPLTNPDAKPTELETAEEAEAILLTWTDNSEDEQGFLIQRYDATGWIDLATVAADVTSYVDRELTPGSNYCYRVLAFNSSTQSTVINDACGTTALLPQTDPLLEPTPPAAPSNLSTTVGTDSIELTWKDNASDEQGFNIWRSADKTNWTKHASTDANKTTFVDAAVEPDQSYCYRVSVFNTAGESDQTSEACAVVAAPVTATGGGGGSSTPSGPCPVMCTSSKPNRAFPTAEGFGALSQGGRGGRVIHVTNLDDYYTYIGDSVIPGSLRWAVEIETGPRIIVFDVGGTILLKSYLMFVEEQGSYITIAGQTAPGDGIQLGQYGLRICDGAHDIIIRHIRVRNTMTSFVPPIDSDGSFLKKAVLIGKWRKSFDYINHDIIFDHCSLEWGLDDSYGAGTCRRVTLQWSIIGEGSLYGDVLPSGVYDGDLNYSRSGAASQGAVAGDEYNTFDDFMSVHHILFINNHTRNMLIYTDGSTMEFINNYVYNTNIGTYVAQHYGITESTHLNFIGNHYSGGADKRPLALHEECTRYAAESNAPTLSCLYVQDNLDDYWRPDSTYPEWDVAAWVHWPGYNTYLPEGLVASFFINPLPEIYRAANPFPGAATPVTIHAAADLEDVLSPAVGATVPSRDSVDTRLINELNTKTGAIGIGAVQQPPHWAADGTLTTSGHNPLPTLNSGTPPTDTDADGMPDDWETSQNLDPNNPADGPLDPDGDGYTNVEEYLNSLVGEE